MQKAGFLITMLIWYQFLWTRLHSFCISNQDFNGTKSYKETSADEKTSVNSHPNDLPYKLAANVKERQDKLLTMYWFTKDRIKLDSLPTLALQQNCLNY